MGPDSLLLAYAVLVSALVATLAWRRAGLVAGISATLVVAIALAVWQGMRPDFAPGLNHQLVGAAMVIVPSALLLGASRLRWLARHAWVLLLIGPVVFGGCYVGICELCVKAHLI
jgi:hypothetical protein